MHHYMLKDEADSKKQHTHCQQEGSENHPAGFKVPQQFCAPGRAVTDHVHNVLTELVHPCNYISICKYNIDLRTQSHDVKEHVTERLIIT